MLQGESWEAPSLVDLNISYTLAQDLTIADTYKYQKPVASDAMEAHRAAVRAVSAGTCRVRKDSVGVNLTLDSLCLLFAAQ